MATKLSYVSKVQNKAKQHRTSSLSNAILVKEVNFWLSRCFFSTAAFAILFSTGEPPDPSCVEMSLTTTRL